MHLKLTNYVIPLLAVYETINIVNIGRKKKNLYMIHMIFEFGITLQEFM